MSIPSNIAEGYGRKTTLDYVRMLYISYGSVCELETQISLAEKRYRRNRKNVIGADKVFRKQTLDSLDPLLQLNWRRIIYVTRKRSDAYQFEINRGTKKYRLQSLRRTAAGPWKRT